ncbi:MAG: fasciclin domain-containing protein [Bacillota bacterium]
MLNDNIEDSGQGLFTVFAPTDAAFEDLIAEPNGIDDIADLLALENIADILLYHVLSGQVMAEDVVELDVQTVETLSGDNITISIQCCCLQPLR